MKDNKQEYNLRPTKLAEYIGQRKIVQTLQLFLDAVKKRGIATEHVLLYDLPELGRQLLPLLLQMS